MGTEAADVVSPDACLQIVADDLTGALDSAAPFASPAHPVHVGFSWRAAPVARRLSISTDSRDLSPEDSEQVVIASMQAVAATAASDTLWFKKVDSVLRGNPIGETLAALQVLGLSHLVFAPAYPDLGRITVQGQNHVVEADGALRPVGPDLTRAFRRPSDTAEWPVVHVIDATTQAELRAAVSRLCSLLPRSTLWAGAGGLALALGGGGGPVAFPPLARVLVGTRHPVTQEQVGYLTARLESQPGPDLFHPALASATPDDTAAAISAHCRTFDAGDLAGRSVLVVGGDTLATVLRAVEAEHLICIGEASAGVAVSQIVGGRWSGITLVSKSGGFGTRDLLHRLARGQGDLSS